MSKFQNDSIFWIEVEKIKPNPYQPRKEFNDEKLGYLAESIRQYGVLQPLVVTRKEIQKPDGGLMAEYELIAGERRLRASKLAGLAQVPAIIREGDESEGAKLELAIIENLQREDLNPIDRAVAFQRLAEEFNFKHTEIARKIGKSREYVSNSLRLLSLPEEIKNAISSTQITEGHARPLMMLKDRPEEQATLFKEILYKKLTVRDAETIARKVAQDRIRRKVLPPDPEILELEGQLAESLGTRVQIERKEVGGKLTIDFFSNEDLKKILELVHSNEKKNPHEMLDNYIESSKIVESKPVFEETQSGVNVSQPIIDNGGKETSFEEKKGGEIDNLIKEVNEGRITEGISTEKFPIEKINDEKKEEITVEEIEEIKVEQEKEKTDEDDTNFIETESESEIKKENIYMIGDNFNPSSPELVSSQSEVREEQAKDISEETEIDLIQKENQLKENNHQSFSQEQSKQEEQSEQIEQTEELDKDVVILKNNGEFISEEESQQSMNNNNSSGQKVETFDNNLVENMDNQNNNGEKPTEQIESEKKIDVDENDDLYSVKDFNI